MWWIAIWETPANSSPDHKASNPAVSDEGRCIAFQYARRGDRAGIGRGILIFDLAACEAGERQPGGNAAGLPPRGAP